MRERTAPEIFSVSARAFAVSVFPPDACIPGTVGFAVAKATVDDQFSPQGCAGNALEPEHRVLLSKSGGRP
ncbi:hypothetical protein [Thioalkalivibrio sp.]|uniref:hypothetical protein n=1 Tax=Thioalkalivibrio sp. TaxID=2093813 RepID=UPI0039747979